MYTFPVESLKRFFIGRVKSNDGGTFGVMMDDRSPFAVTIEPPWKYNQPFISCIPAGIYTCKRIQSARFRNTFEIIDVPGRTHIVVHGANLGAGDLARLIEPDTKGCIGVADEFDELYGLPAVKDAKSGMRKFRKKTEGLDKFQLEILNPWSGHHERNIQKTD